MSQKSFGLPSRLGAKTSAPRRKKIVTVWHLLSHYGISLFFYVNLNGSEGLWACGLVTTSACIQKYAITEMLTVRPASALLPAICRAASKDAWPMGLPHIGFAHKSSKSFVQPSKVLVLTYRN